MFLYRIFSVFILFILLSGDCMAQQSGGNPPSIKWRQINIPAGRVIFPSGSDSTANRIANVIAFLEKPTEKTIGSRFRKINIVLQNETSISNGYVGLAPFRSEFYLTAPQNSFDLGSIPWPDMLSVHEYRHVEQYGNFDVGLSGVMRSVFGDGGQALANGASIPNWFFEGDAVYNETNVTKQGRGRLPSFFDGYKSLWEAGKTYNWMQLRNGSLKNYVPNHYPLGYMLVAYGREKYGDEFWKEVTQDAAAFKGLFYPLQKAIRKYSGISFKAFRNEALDYFKTQLNTVENKDASILQKGIYSNEQNPILTENGEIVFLKNSFDKIPVFTLRKEDGRDQKIRVSDYAIDPYFSYANNKIVYAAYRSDVRWKYRDYNEIRILDLANGKQHSVTKRSRYFSPDISRDGQWIVAVKEDNRDRQKLQLLNAETGEVVKEMPNSESFIYTYPKFTEGNKVVAAVRNSEGKMSVAQMDFDTGETTILLPFTWNVTGFPVEFSDTLYFTASHEKNDELFAYTFQDKKIWKLTGPETIGLGKYHPSVNNETVIWQSFTANGNKLIRVAKSDLKFRELSIRDLLENASDMGISCLNNTNSNLLQKVPHDTFTISKYRKSFHLFNFHSIIPDISDPDYTLSLVGENILNTFGSELAITYNRAEGYKRIGFSGTYSALFPYLSGGINYTFDRRIYLDGNAVYFNQLEPYAGLQIPLNLSRGRSFTFLTAGSQYVFNKSYFKGYYKDSLANRDYSYLNNYLSFSNQVQKASKQIFPAIAQSFLVSYKTALNNYTGRQILLNGNIYLPGIFKNNSLVLNGAWLKKDSLRQINFSSGFPFSRGYEAANFNTMYKWGVNYHFPLLYPDAGLGNILYVLRVRANVFFDDTMIRDFNQSRQKVTADFRSVGTEFSFDTKWWNEVNVSFGFRYSYLLDRDVYGQPGPNRWEIILPVNLFNN